MPIKLKPSYHVIRHRQDDDLYWCISNVSHRDGWKQRNATIVSRFVQTLPEFGYVVPASSLPADVTLSFPQRRSHPY